jgi:hypothetical protein
LAPVAALQLALEFPPEEGDAKPASSVTSGGEYKPFDFFYPEIAGHVWRLKYEDGARRIALPVSLEVSGEPLTLVVGRLQPAFLRFAGLRPVYAKLEHGMLRFACRPVRVEGSGRRQRLKPDVPLVEAAWYLEPIEYREPKLIRLNLEPREVPLEETGCFLEGLVGAVVRGSFYARDAVLWQAVSLPFRLESVCQEGDRLSLRGTGGVMVELSSVEQIRVQFYPQTGTSIIINAFTPGMGYLASFQLQDHTVP